MDRIQLRRDTAARWAEVNPILLEGEVGYETDTNLRKIGDGVTKWNSLPYLRAEGIVQTTGNSTTEVMSQKATTDKFTELESAEGRNIIVNRGGKVSFVETTPNGEVAYTYSFSKNIKYRIRITPNTGGNSLYLRFKHSDGTYTNQYIDNTSYYSFTPDKNYESLSILYGSTMTATSVMIDIDSECDRINYAPEYSQFNGVFKKFGMIESVEYLSQNKRVRLKESRGSWVFGFKIDIDSSPFNVGDSLCVGFKNVALNAGSGFICFACYDSIETRLGALKSISLTTTDILQLSLEVPSNTKYVVAYVQGSKSLDVTLGECVLVRGDAIEDNYIYSRNSLGDNTITAINYAPYYTNFKKALLPNDMNVSVLSNNRVIMSNESGAKVFGFQVKLSDTPFTAGDWITIRAKDVILNSGSGYLMLLFYDAEENRLGAANSVNLTTSEYVELYKEIPQNTELIVARFQSSGALNAEVGEFIFTKDNLKGDSIRWIRNEIISGGSSSSNSQTIYVDGDLGDDSNNGTKQMPLKTLTEAVKKAGDDACIMLQGNVYDRLNIKENVNQKSIRIVGEQGKVNRIVLGQMIDSATLVQTDVYQCPISSFPSESTSYCLWQHDIQDSRTAITESEKHPLQRGKTHRLDSTKLSRVGSLNEVKLSSNPVFYYDSSNGIIYFRTVGGSSLKENPIYLPTPDAAIYGNDGSVKLELVNIEAWYSNIDLSGCDGAIVTECAAKFGVNGGITWKDCNGLQLIRCEACGTHDYDNNYGDGFSVGSTISEPTTAKCATAVMYDCWSHDNHDDGYSDHLNNETTIDGGLFENNDGGVTTSYGSKDIVRNVYARNNTEAGITVYGGNAEGTESFVQNCICEKNSPYNFSVVNGGARSTRGVFVNCISIDAENTGYYASGSNVGMKIINCYDNGSPTIKSSNVVSVKANLV